jgi:hypothetical protein
MPGTCAAEATATQEGHVFHPPPCQRCFAMPLMCNCSPIVFPASADQSGKKPGSTAPPQKESDTSTAGRRPQELCPSPTGGQPSSKTAKKALLLQAVRYLLWKRAGKIWRSSSAPPLRHQNLCECSQLCTIHTIFL